MKFLINNNTTYNYSYYATRPKWLVEALVKEYLSQKEFLKPFKKGLKEPFSHKVTFAPLTLALTNRSDKDSRTQKPWTFSQRPKSQAGSTKVTSLTQNPFKIKGPRHLFQTKELLCWTSDLSFFNLRGYFSNILKALQICRFAVRNNKKILFVKGGGSNNGQGKRLNSWLVQYKRNAVPQTLNDLFNKRNRNSTQPLLFSQILSPKKSKDSGQKIRDPNKMVNLMKNSLSQQGVLRGAQFLQSHPLARKSCLDPNKLKESSNSRLKKKYTAGEKQNCKTAIYHKYYQLSGLLNRCLSLSHGDTSNSNMSHFQNPSALVFRGNNQGTFAKPRSSQLFSKEPLPKTGNNRKKSPTLPNLYLENQNEGLQRQPFRSNFKYGPPRKKTTISINNAIKLRIKEAQAMSQQTAAGLTTPLAGFLTNTKTAFNTICNLSNYDFYNSVNSNLKSSSLLNEEICEIKTNRLERVNFQKSCHLFSQSLAPALQTFALTTTKEKGKNYYRGSDADRARDSNQKEWWVDNSNSHYYSPLTASRGRIFFKDSELTSCNKSSKKRSPLEYFIFGDLLTWQLKSQKSSSMFYTNTTSSKNKDGAVSYLKKGIRLDKRGPVVLKKKKKAPFFTSFKKQLQTFKSLKRKLKEPLKYLDKRKIKEQKKGFSLKRGQILATLAKFVVFDFSGHRLPRNQAKRVKLTKTNQTFLFLPSFPTIKTKIKIITNSGDFRKRDYKPAYRCNLAFDIFEHTFNKQDKIKPLQGRGPKVFFRTAASAQENQKTKEQRQRLRTLSFYKYYKTIIALNHLNQYRKFAKTPFINSRLADIIFFINPEKNQRLVNQANSLKIPTVGVVSGNTASAQGHQGYNNFRLKESVYYPILGNPTSSFFTRVIISLIVKCLRVEKSKNTVNKG